MNESPDPRLIDSRLPASPAGLRFLVVEDQGFQRWMIGNMLGSMGATSIELCEDGAEALRVLENKPFDVVICDLDMPHMDGMEFMRHLGEARAQVSLAVCTAMSKALVASVEAMAVAYGVRLLGTVSKPPTPAALAAIIARHGRLPERTPPVLREHSVGEILEGLARSEFEAYFQPKVRVSDGGLAGAEALARWRHPQLGLVSPTAFVPALEAAGEIGRLTDTMTESALRACRTWRDEGLDATVALNLALPSVCEIGFADRMLQSVERHGLQPDMVVLELTESGEATHLGQALENLSRLRMRGFGLSIDDYGTGYSSMQQLARVPFTELKIDRGFVRNALQRPSHRTMLESSLEVARRLGITAVAEGVETAEEWDLLRRLECPIAQGYFVSRPLAAQEFRKWAASRGR